MLNRNATEREVKSFPSDYIEKVYAGLLGKVIGVRHGSNVESWSYDKIERTFGEITGYLFDFKHFAADDDTNGPMFFLRALEDYTFDRDITAEQMGKTWLNYAPDGHGFYWWGGYGRSTENTAYVNLKNGIMAPRSGSAAQNGLAVAEQIGGQILIDGCGGIGPGDSTLAAESAEKITSVSHDGNGIYGGMFIAACIAEAFVEQDIKKIIEVGLSVIPSDCEYTRMTQAVMAFYEQKPDDWRDAFQFVSQNFGYDRYPGSCHIIPNSAVIILSLLYSDGDFSKAINICNMCGWDTDCNVANVGSIMGVRNGLDGIDWEWRKPINDFLCCSSVIGSLNMLDVPWCASYIANFGYKIAGEEPPEAWKSILSDEGPQFHFEYPGSTHGFKMECDDDTFLPPYVTAKLVNTMEMSADGSRSLKISFDRTIAGNGYRTFHRTYYTPEDFNDSRYDPSFSPKLYPGQAIEAKVATHHSTHTDVLVRLYVKDRNTGIRHYGDKVTLMKGQWATVTFQIPWIDNACLIEAGIEWIPIEGWVSQHDLIVYVAAMKISGQPNYSIDFAKERIEKWHALHHEVSQFSYLRGIWTLEDGYLSGTYSKEPAECYTGLLDWEDYEFTATIRPQLGDHHHVLFRVQGAIRSYAVGLAPSGRFALYKNDNGYRELAAVDLAWSMDQEYEVKIAAVGHTFSVSVDGVNVLEYRDNEQPYLNGMVGFSNWGGSHTHYQRFTVKGIGGWGK